MRIVRPSAACLVTLVLLLAACGDADDGGVTTDAPSTDAPSSGPASGPAVDVELTRDDVDCSPEAVGADFADFTVVHLVVDGVLGEVCLGESDPTLLEAWEALAVIAPRLARADLGLFGGFASDDDDEEVTLAFVNSIDDDGTLFQMSVNLDTHSDDADEALLTMAHEFSHVFTQLPSELDRSPESEATCATYDNGEGCFVEGSLMADWIAEFWPDELLDQLDLDVEPTVASGEGRCVRNADFLGPYAASNPEEDFAETFSAYVFDVELDPALGDKLDWIADRGGLVEFRDRAVAAGLTPLDFDFELCG